MNEALAESMETQAWLDHAFDCDYINRKEHAELDREWQRLGGMLNRTIGQSASFCHPATKKK